MRSGRGGGCCRSFPGLVGTGPGHGGLACSRGDWVKERREARRPLPPADSPNVLLIVMDTVRADRLSLYGYHRPTTPRLEQLAKRGIRFDKVRATAPWTLPSHASMFTGRWPHELGVEWMTPLRGKFPTLAEYLGSRGYATAGFAANTLSVHTTPASTGASLITRITSSDRSPPSRTAFAVDHRLQSGCSSLAVKLRPKF